MSRHAQAPNPHLEEAVAHLQSHDAVLRSVIDRVGPCQLQPHSDYYRELVESIISQQLSVKAAATITGRFKQLGVGEFPTPQEILALETERLRAVGLSGAKAGYVQDLAMHVRDGRLDIERLPELPNEEIIVRLTDIKGIGEWTAHMSRWRHGIFGDRSRWALDGPAISRHYKHNRNKNQKDKSECKYT
jgi:DNA-3-methyladenine glycosylase II